MAAPAPQGSLAGAPQASDATTSTFVPFPTGLAVGETIMMVCTTVSARTLTTASLSGTGWSLVGNNTGRSGINFYVFRKVATSGDLTAAGVTVTHNSFSAFRATVGRISDAKDAAPTLAANAGTNDQTQTTADITTPTADCLVFWLIGVLAAGTSSTSAPGVTKWGDNNGTGVFYQAVPSASLVSGITISTPSTFGVKPMDAIAWEAASASTPTQSRSKKCGKVRKAA